MKDNYYTPTIEEFHVGFEYQLNYDERQLHGHRELHWQNKLGWNTVYVPLDCRLKCFKDYINEGRIRVKKLSKECIESLGYKVEVLGVGEDTEYDELNITRDGSSIGCLFVDPTVHNCNVELLNSFYNIKNKSEFKRLLQQMNIK